MILFSFLLLFSSPLKAQDVPTQLHGKDYFEIPYTAPQTVDVSAFEIIPTDCRANIAKVVCLVDPPTTGQDMKNRTCLPSSENYVGVFEALYDNYPPALQKMFCSLRYLFIEKKTDGSAYAGTIKDANGVTHGAMMGIRQSILDQSLNLQTWASWKEQLSFGGIAGSYTVTENLPHVFTSVQRPVNDFLYFVVSHEFGHIFDFANNLNQTQNCPKPANDEEDVDCEFAPNSWGALSWDSTHRPKAIYDYAARKDLCFYWCNGKSLQAADVPAVYDDFAKINFMSLYASTNPWDDFAENLAYYLADQNLGLHYSIDTLQGQSFDMILKLHSPLLNSKYEYIQKFLSRTDIVYP